MRHQALQPRSLELVNPRKRRLRLFPQGLQVSGAEAIELPVDHAEAVVAR